MLLLISKKFFFNLYASTSLEMHIGTPLEAQPPEQLQIKVAWENKDDGYTPNNMTEAIFYKQSLLKS